MTIFLYDIHCYGFFFSQQLPNFSMFPSLPPHIAHLTVKKNMPQFFMPDELKMVSCPIVNEDVYVPIVSYWKLYITEFRYIVLGGEFNGKLNIFHIFFFSFCQDILNKHALTMAQLDTTQTTGKDNRGLNQTMCGRQYWHPPPFTL